jgi:hypothetical protein
MFSLRTLLALVTLSAVYIAGMVYRTEWWEASLLMLTYLIFAAALSAAILAHERRAFLVAFVAFGLGYGVCLYSPIGDGIITRNLLSRLADRVARADEDFLQDVLDARKLDGEVTPPANPFQDDPFRPFDRGWLYFIHIGHAFIAVIIGCVAGVVAETLVRRRSLSNRDTETL